MTQRPKIIVLDDDPTGSQTVHSCLLLMRWDVETLRLGLANAAPIFFKVAIAAESIQDFLVVSRSDSTLRGHYPIETDVIAEALGPFDAHFLVPAFFEGGRVTYDSVHYLMVDGKPTPVHETEFAKDSVFGFSHSYLPDYVAEKTSGKISARQVERFLLEDLRSGCSDRLMKLSGNCCVAVDAQQQDDLDRFAQDVLAAAATGKRFLFRSAASLLTALAQLPPQPIPAEQMAQYVRGEHPGAFIVGSHVKKTTEQLAYLLAQPNIAGIEVSVSQLQNGADAYADLLQETLGKVKAHHSRGQTPVVYTSRQELQFDDTQTRLQFGMTVSALLMDIVKGLPSNIGYLVSKGGITSNDVLSQGLSLRTAWLLGQIIPGCSVIKTSSERALFPELPVVLFPGNVGTRESLVLVYQRFTRENSFQD
jgi:uncharacterized protein YgbK (DUF1537 family)